jgi:2,3-bisphosphoglycerate-independent phosphoglycerate mutase
MKYVIIVGDGMADYPIDSLGGKTPLTAAKTPNMDWLASHGELGLVKTIPDGIAPGSEAANLSILGYDPARYFTGRGPIEAASLGVELKADDVAFRFNLVTLMSRDASVVMEDYAAGHITDEEAREIVLALDKQMGTKEFEFYPGVSYRHLMVWREGAVRCPGIEKLDLTPPHDIIGKGIAAYLPGRGASSADHGAGQLMTLMKQSEPLLRNHPVNVAREKKGVLPGNAIWFWGQGRSPRMSTLKDRFGMEGYVISGVHLIKGIGALAGLTALDVPGATGYFDTNYAGKTAYALEALRSKDFVYVHVEAPDEAGHMGDAAVKVGCIEAFDEKIVGPLLKGMQSFERYRVMLLPDHATPIRLRTHSSDPVPFVIYRGGGKKPGSGAKRFDEVSAGQTGIFVETGHELIERFLA